MRNLALGHLGRIILLAVGLAGCGFTPVYAPDSETSRALSNISVAAPKNRYSYIFAREMEDRIGRPAHATRVLRYHIGIAGEGIESDTERRRFVGSATYRLIDSDTGKEILNGSVDSFTGYSVSNGLFSSARQDALERLMIILADQVSRELMAKL